MSGRFYGGFGRGFSLIYVFGFMSLGVYFLLFSSWGSNRKYALLGGYRSISQTVSYEVSLVFFVLGYVYIFFSFDMGVCQFFQIGYWFLFFRALFFYRWGFVLLAESNRTPFDFSEGESELVSGFNTEYRRGIFSLIFICEYGMILFLRFLRVSLFWGGSSLPLKLGVMGVLFV